MAWRTFGLRCDPRLSITTVSPAKRRGEALRDVGPEARPVDGALDHEGSGDAVPAQSGHEGGCGPMPERRLADEPRATPAAPARTGHVGLGPGLVDEDETGRIHAGLLLAPALARRGNVRTLLLGGAQ